MISEADPGRPPRSVACVAHAHVLRVLAARWIGLEADGGPVLCAAGTGCHASEPRLGAGGQPVIAGWNQT